MAAPVLLGFIFLVLYPVVSVIRDSFTSYNPLSGEAAFIGADNYTRLIQDETCLLYTSPSPRDRQKSRMPSSA